MLIYSIGIEVPYDIPSLIWLLIYSVLPFTVEENVQMYIHIRTNRTTDIVSLCVFYSYGNLTFER